MVARRRIAIDRKGYGHRCARRGAAMLAIWIFASATAVGAQLGDPAPPIAVAEWVHGKPLDAAQDKEKRIIVVEIWATWAQPSLRAIPRLTAIQKKYAEQDVRVVAISDEPPATVRDFVKSQKEKIGFAVGVDRESATTTAFMKAFRIEARPHAFVVDKGGRLVWHGAPNSPELDRTLSELVAGTFDLAAMRRRAELAESERLRNEQIERALRAYVEVAGREGALDDAKRAGQALLKQCEGNPRALNLLSYNILESKMIPDKQRDLPLALQAARAANEATGGRDAAVLDTYAMALFKNGEVDEAIRQQKQALAINKDESLQDLLEAHLKRFNWEMEPGEAKKE